MGRGGGGGNAQLAGMLLALCRVCHALCRTLGSDVGSPGVKSVHHAMHDFVQKQGGSVGVEGGAELELHRKVEPAGGGVWSRLKLPRIAQVREQLCIFCKGLCVGKGWSEGGEEAGGRSGNAPLLVSEPAAAPWKCTSQ